MDLASTAHLQARRELYDLLARLYLRPPDAALLATLRTLPELGAPIPPAPNALEELEVEYEFVFGRNVYPYGSLYLDRELMLHTAAADRAARLYAACGFAAGGAAGAPDHLGLELGLMGHLLAQEISALHSQDAAARRRAVLHQGRCLHEHLARWAPICLRAVERVATHPLYQNIAQLTLELVLTDLERIDRPEPERAPAEPQPVAPQTPAPFQPADADAIPFRPYPEQPAGDLERGVNRVVRQLITPADVGVFLSRRDLSSLGRRLGLPTPIGERFQMLRGLFESAGQFELVAPLLDALAALFAAEADQLAALAQRYPAWGTHAQEWRDRLARGRELLAELHAEARAGLDDAAS